MNGIIEWKSILLIFLILFMVLIIIKIIDKKINLKSEMKRKLFHISMGLVMLILPYIFSNTLSVGILGIIALIVMYILKHTKLKQNLGDIIYGVDRESLGEIFFVLSVFLIFYLSKGNKVLYSIPILVLTFADSTAALIGKNYAKENLAESNEDAKSIEGSFMFFIVAFMAALIPILLYTNVGRAETLIISAIIGFNVALIEMISHTGNDNLLIPLTTYAFLATHINLNAEELKFKLLILLGIFLLVTVANRVKTWSKLALVELIVVGYLTISLYGIYAIVPPLIMLLTVMRFPSIKENEKSNLYDARIIETNVIIGTAICGIVAVTGWKKEFFLIYATCYSMHLIINTFVRFKYYLKYSEIDSLLLAINKGIGFIFIPSLIVQYIVFRETTSLPMLFIMILAMIASGILICIAKRQVKREEITIKNGHLHTTIAFVLTLFVGSVQFLKLI